MSAAWAIADIFMAGMALINIPCIVVAGKYVFMALADFEKQALSGKNPVFTASSVGLDRLECWK